MPTLMTTGTFGELAKIRSALDAGPLASRKDEKLAGIFVPWAGSSLKGEGGIYYVGMATDGGYWADDPQTFDQRSQCTELLCAPHTRDERMRSPFWQFLDGLSWALLGAPYDETSDRWGWSNLLKIGWSVGNPNQWRPPVEPQLKDAQRDICVIALREEFEKLHGSLIVICSGNTFGVLESPDFFPRLVPQWQKNYADNWNRDREETGVWWFIDPNSGNLYVHGYHPNYAVINNFWGSALRYTIHLARTLLPRFA